MQVAVRVRLAVIPSVDEAFHDLGTLTFVASHLFSAGGRHSSAVADLLRLIERLEELHTEVQGMISSPHLSTTLLFDVSRQWSQYLYRCVAASASEVEGHWRPASPFSSNQSWLIWREDATPAPLSLTHWPTSLQEVGQQAGVPRREAAVSVVAAVVVEAAAAAA